MTPSDDFFTPEEVDTQIDSLLHSAGQLQEPKTQEARIVAQIHRFYAQTPDSQLYTLTRAWKRIIEEHQPVKLPSPAKGNHVVMQNTQEVQPIHKDKPNMLKRQPLRQRLSMLAAILVVGLLIGGMVLVINATRQTTKVGSPQLTIATQTALPKTPPPQSIGTVLSTVQDTGGLISWSPDSTRVAALSLNGFLTTGVQIWDATTGKHLVHVQVPPDAVNGDVYVSDMAWSPNGQLIALAARDNLVIVDAQTGAIVHQYGINSPVALIPHSTSGPLATLMPASGALGFQSVAWSPDGRSLAVSVLAGSTDVVEIVNAQTGIPTFDLASGPSTSSAIIGKLRWSADSQYVAGAAIGYLGIMDLLGKPSVWAWSVASHQIVFQSTAFPNSDAVWQPGSDNLAFASVDMASQQNTGLEVWNVAANKVVKVYHVSAYGALTWSPDGQELAYTGFADKSSGIILINAQSERQIYLFPINLNFRQVGALAWSPNGKYIASSESGIGQPPSPGQAPPVPTSRVQVWIAS